MLQSRGYKKDHVDGLLAFGTDENGKIGARDRHLTGKTLFIKFL